MECVFVWVPIILISHPLQLVNPVEVMGTTLVQTECVHTQATQRGLQALAGMHPRCVLIPLLRPCFVPMLPKSFVQVVCLFFPNSQSGNVLYVVLYVGSTSLLVSRGGHLYVLCQCICNQDQNWIKQSKPFLGGNQRIKVTSELLKSMDQEYTAANWTVTF